MMKFKNKLLSMLISLLMICSMAPAAHAEAIGDTTVVDWGSSGQVIPPEGLTNVKSIAAGNAYAIALKEDGTLVAWGSNPDGVNVPADLTSVKAIAAGDNHAIALKEDGTVVVWGRSSYGQKNIPYNLTSVKALAAGDTDCVALKEDGTVVVWGMIYQYPDEIKLPEGGLTDVKAIAAGGKHVAALKEDGTIVVWGYAYDGLNTIPADLTNVKDITVGDNHIVALKEDGALVAWGSNTYGQTNVPAGLTNVKDIEANGNYTVALKEDGTAVAWGCWEREGEVTVPQDFTNILKVAAGDTHIVVIKQFQEQSQPTENLEGVAPTSNGGSDGMISGATTSMEYRGSLDSNYTTVSGTSIIGLEAGTYYVRYSAKPGYYAGSDSVVIVDEGTDFQVTNGVLTKYTGDDLEVVIPTNMGITSIGDAAFYSSTIASVNIPESVTNIGVEAFRNCTNLTSITIPQNVNNIGPAAFWSCNNLRNINSFPTTAPLAYSDSFLGLPSDAVLNLIPGANGYGVWPWTQLQQNIISPTTIVITVPPAKTEYLVGESLDLTGMVIEGIFNGGITSIVPVTSANLTGFENSKPGSQLINVTVGNANTTFIVNVNAQKVLSIAVTGENGSTSVEVNETMQMKTIVLPTNATDSAVNWSVENETGTATIDQYGVLKGISTGYVTVVATAQDGSGVKGSAIIKVTQPSVPTSTIPVKKITVTGLNGVTSVKMNSTLQMQVKAYPYDATNQDVAWSVKNSSGQATISTTGVLIGTRAGKVTVIATATDGSGVKGSISITIAK